MSVLDQLQHETQEWRLQQGHSEDLFEMAAGVVGEVGELLQTILHERWGDRYIDAPPHINSAAQLQAFDACGDIMIFLAGVANAAGFSLEQAADQTWKQVKLRTKERYASQ